MIRAELPSASTLDGALRLADRGYLCLGYLRELTSAQGLVEVGVSTGKVAMCASHVPLPIFQALIAGKAAALHGALSDAREHQSL